MKIRVNYTEKLLKNALKKNACMHAQPTLASSGCAAGRPAEADGFVVYSRFKIQITLHLS